MRLVRERGCGRFFCKVCVRFWRKRGLKDVLEEVKKGIWLNFRFFLFEEYRVLGLEVFKGKIKISFYMVREFRGIVLVEV